MKSENGCTRVVFHLEGVVIKVPNYRYKWHHFLSGLLANMTERDTWKWAINPNNESGKPELLCPVIWASWGGWILIMRRADVMAHEIEMSEIDPFPPNRYQTWVEAGFDSDNKPDNFGYLNGKLVKVDYGA